MDSQKIISKINQNGNIINTENKKETINKKNISLKTDFVKKLSLEPEDFNEFTYSRIPHLEFFLKKRYDLLLFGRKINIDNCSLEDYQSLLIYSFIINNVTPGSKVLKIGTKGSSILDAINFEYECWEMNDSAELSGNPLSDEFDMKITNFTNKEMKLVNYYGYFDFVFSISAFEKLPQNDSIYKNIVFNLNSISGYGRFSIHIFNLVLLKEFNLLNFLLFHIFSDTFDLYEKINHYIEQRLIPDDPNIFYIEKFLSEVENTLDTSYQTKNVRVLSYNLLLRKRVHKIPKITKTTPAEFRKKNPAYIFHHLMKCGGTSLAVALEKWFTMEDEFMFDVNNNSNNFELNAFIKHKLNLNNISSDTCIRGHYHDEGFYIHQRYPEVLSGNKEFKIFTFIRDPLCLRISLYFYLNKEEVYYNNDSLIDSLINFDNIFSYWLPCDKKNYKKVLDRYFFIGIVEKMQESFDKLADITGKKRNLVPTFNTTKKDSQISELTPEFIERFKKNNHLDYLIYNYCLEKFNKL